MMQDMQVSRYSPDGRQAVKVTGSGPKGNPIVNILPGFCYLTCELLVGGRLNGQRITQSARI